MTNHWYLEPEPATRTEVQETLQQIWHWECRGIQDGWFGTEEAYELAEQLWMEKYS